MCSGSIRKFALMEKICYLLTLSDFIETFQPLKQYQRKKHEKNFFSSYPCIFVSSV